MSILAKSLHTFEVENAEKPIISGGYNISELFHTNS